MIVKIKNSKDGWSYFECEIIHSTWTTLEKATDRGECINLLERKEVDITVDTAIKRLGLETEKNHLRTILTDRVCYVLNNQGKTIDRI
ncbi:hypothetical protein LCGC14_0306010 [marine sediment metagenome]|uniref:Uncharacterized protein n=1 Tax=marine sediment metagenome TaxID=412755 RepID=A0A0F9U674_9ZZZZ